MGKLESALPLMNLSDILTVENNFTLQILSGIKCSSQVYLMNTFTRSVFYSYHTRYAAKGNFYKARFRNNISLSSRPLALTAI